MNTRKKFFGMNAQERDAFFASEAVKDFLQRTRDMAMQKRTVTGADLTIPTVVLELIRENIESYSKLVSRVRLRSVSGRGRQNVMGAMPEAVWTEACASLNELDFGFSQTEVDGYKVGGVIYICIATLEDSDYDLASEIITALGASIGIAVDKAILYGTGVKMPQGIVTRLAQQSAPSDYPAVARPWEDLHTTNCITITGKTGIALFQELARATNVLPDAVCVALGLNTDTAEPKDAFEMLAALAVSGGGSGDVGELEDTALEVGTITNAGAGWNTFKFREAFDAAPQVVCQAEDFDGIVQVKSVTADGFLYCLRTLSTGSYYTGSSSGSTPSHSANTLVNGSTTTATAVKIRYMAIEYGGER